MRAAALLVRLQRRRCLARRHVMHLGPFTGKQRDNWWPRHARALLSSQASSVTTGARGLLSCHAHVLEMWAGLLAGRPAGRYYAARLCSIRLSLLRAALHQ